MAVAFGVKEREVGVGFAFDVFAGIFHGFAYSIKTGWRVVVLDFVPYLLNLRFGVCEGGVQVISPHACAEVVCGMVFLEFPFSLSMLPEGFVVGFFEAFLPFG